MKKSSVQRRAVSFMVTMMLLIVSTVVAFAVPAQNLRIGTNDYSYLKHLSDSSSLTACFAAEGYSMTAFNANISAIPSKIEESIEGYPVVCMRGAFRNAALSSSPTIPQYMQDMDSAFASSSIVAPPVIPDGVTSMKGAFSVCSNLRTYPVLPPAVTNIENIFYNCSLASGTVEIPSTVNQMMSAFRDNKQLKSIPDISKLASVVNMRYAFYGCSTATGGTDLPVTVPTDLSSLFSGCAKMTTPPSVIPSNVTKTHSMFDGCNSLSGTIDIRATLSVDKPLDYANMFAAVATEPGAQLTLNYTAQNEAVIDDIISKKTILSNLVKGSLLGEEGTVEPDPNPEEPENPGEGGGDTPPPATGNFELVDGKGEQEVIIEGIVEPINTLDVDVPLKLQFVIDEARNITYTQGARVTSRSPAPLVVTCKSITVPAGAPKPVADDAFSDWDNLSVSQTMNNIAISLNGKNLFVPGTKLGDIASGYGGPAQLPITMKVLYGKQWNNTSQLVFDYSMNMEIALAE